MLYNRLGTGNKKYKVKFIYAETKRSAIKYVYANTIEEAKELFNNYYKDFKVQIKEITEEDV